MPDSVSENDIDPYSGEVVPSTESAPTASQNSGRGSINSLLNPSEDANASEPTNNLHQDSEIEKVAESENVDGTNIDPYSGDMTVPKSVTEVKSGKPVEEKREYTFEDYDMESRRPKKRRTLQTKGRSAFSLRRNTEEEEEEEEEEKPITHASIDDLPLKPEPEIDYGREDENKEDEKEETEEASKKADILSSWKAPEKKLKRPTRRKNIEDQIKRAQEIRKREEENEYRRYELEQQQQNNANINDTIRSHYDQLARTARKVKRDDSDIYKLRNFNNVLKYMLIGKFCQERAKVMDIACGKGGDLFKWKMAHASLYVGLDISPSSIKEAVFRYKAIKQQQFESIFGVCDAFGSNILEVLAGMQPFSVELPMDMVSIQFALHYAFESEQKIRTTLANIAKVLKPGGYFIGTIPSSDFIKFKIKHLKPGEKKWGNTLYSVEFDNEPPQSGSFVSSPYGNRYTYYLKDAVDHVPEYVVPFEVLRSLAEEYDLELRYKKPFFDLYREEIPSWINKLSPKLLNGLKRSDGKLGLEGEQKQAAEFYLAFAFEKVGH